ncbi:MAG: hypothetical protein KGD64_01580 [Candidatus Heimdallarchaeota archaeon]|nr:hypothetical protein [Candidatus Heimdallarchaeota archaeon]
MWSTKNIENNLDSIQNKSEMEVMIRELKIISSNEKSQEIVTLIKKARKKCIEIDDKENQVILYGLQIGQLYHFKKHLNLVSNLLKSMKELSVEIDYTGGIAFSLMFEWLIEKMKGNKENYSNAIEKSIQTITKEKINDEYIQTMCNYSYAVEIWLENHDVRSTNMLENCLDFFYRNKYYRNLTQTLAILSIIYSHTQKSNKGLRIIQDILSNRNIFNDLPLDVKAITYYFSGLTHLLQANLRLSESYFDEAYDIFKPIYKSSIYFSNFLTLHSYLATVKGLQGKTDQVYALIKDAKTLLQTDYMKTNLDQITRKQIVHTLNLVKFYNISRLGNYAPHEHQELIGKIIDNCKDLYSDFMTLSEFILSANLGSDKLQQLLEIDNFSINRVKYLIEFMFEKQKLDTEINREQKVSNCIVILEKREKTTKTTFMEDAYTDLLIAQQLFSLKRYAEITPLLKKYENRLKQIEVLEMRIFMEAFIQVGAYKNGEPLGPALQYMAIKKCRLYGFSRLENKLLDYLQLQQQEITRTI